MNIPIFCIPSDIRFSDIQFSDIRNSATWSESTSLSILLMDSIYVMYQSPGIKTAAPRIRFAALLARFRVANCRSKHSVKQKQTYFNMPLKNSNCLWRNNSLRTLSIYW